MVADADDSWWWPLLWEPYPYNDDSDRVWMAIVPGSNLIVLDLSLNADLAAAFGCTFVINERDGHYANVRDDDVFEAKSLVKLRQCLRGLDPLSRFPASLPSCRGK